MLKFLFMVLIGLIVAGFNGAIKKFRRLPEPDSQNSFTKKLANRLAVDLNRFEIPGLQVAIIKDDKLSQVALGTADYQRNQLLTNEHIFRLGSITKLYTATIIMKLVEQGQIDLESSVEAWFPALPYAEEITIRNLLNHTSGVYNYTDNRIFQVKTIFNPHRNWPASELYTYVLRGQPVFPPSTNHCYSNSNYLLLGLIAEDVSGQKLSELLHQLILVPHSLDNTVLLPAGQPPVQLITGYDRDMVPFRRHKHLPEHQAWASAGYSAGGLAATATDTARFLHRLFSYHLLKKESVEKMLQFYLCKDPDLPEQNGYGLGIRRLVLEGDTLWGHTGNIPGFSGAAFYCKEQNYYIALLGNSSRLEQTHLLRNIIQTIHEQDLYGEKDNSSSLLMTG